MCSVPKNYYINAHVLFFYTKSEVLATQVSRRMTKEFKIVPYSFLQERLATFVNVYNLGDVYGILLLTSSNYIFIY